MRTLWQDLRYGVRMLLKTPGFTLVAVVALALGIGANSAIFSAVNAFLLRPLPVEKPEELVVLFESDRERRSFDNEFSYLDYRDYRDQSQSFSGLIIHSFASAAIGGGGSSEHDRNGLIWGEVVSGNYFDVLGVRAARGRTFLPEEDRTPGTHAVVVISHNLWQRRFASDANIVGQTISMNGRMFTVIGVAPETFKGTEFAVGLDFWVPVMMEEQIRPGSDRLTNRGPGWFEMVGRLKPGVTREQAEAELTTIARRLAEEHQTTQRDRDVTISVRPEIMGRLGDPEVFEMFSLSGKLALAVASLILLIACANVANLLLARATSRRREIGIRLALGASRWRIVRQLLTESLLLAVAGGGLGFIIAFWTADLWVVFTPTFPFNIVMNFTPDLWVLGWTTLVSLITGVVFGLVPALQASKPDVVPVLKGETQTVSRRARRFSLRSALVVAQVAMSLVVLICGGLFIRSLRHAQTINPGFDPDNVLVMTLDPSLLGYTEDEGRRFYAEVIRRIEALPDVESASAIHYMLLGDSGSSTGPVVLEGQEQPPPGSGTYIYYGIVTPGFFETLRIPLVDGRDFNERDMEGASDVIIINETAARRLFTGENPIGKHIRVGDASSPLREIIGIARDGKYRTLGEPPRSYMYVPQSQRYRPQMTIAVRARGQMTDGFADRVRREVNTLDNRLPVFDVKTMHEHLRYALWGPRTAATLASSFGLLGLLLAAMGIFGVMSYSVAQRTREIGIRMALGAQPRDVLRLVTREGMILTIIGIAIGLVAAFALTRLLSSLLYGVSPNDLVTFTVVALLLSAVAFLASYIPARRATKVDPTVALRYE